MCLLGQDSVERAPLVVIPISYLLPNLWLIFRPRASCSESLFLVCLLVHPFTRLIAQHVLKTGVVLLTSFVRSTEECAYLNRFSSLAHRRSSSSTTGCQHQTRIRLPLRRQILWRLITLSLHELSRRTGISVPQSRSCDSRFHREFVQLIRWTHPVLEGGLKHLRTCT